MQTNPEQWAVELANTMLPPWCGVWDVTAAALAIQAAFAEREARLVGDNQLLREALDADCTAFVAMEQKLIEVADRISGMKGGKPRHPDPVLLSEWVSEINHATLAALKDRTHG